MPGGLLATRPASHAAAVTPNDSTEFQCNAFYVGGTGNVAVVTIDGDSVTFNSVPAGAVIPVQCKKIMSTGTTATNIVRLW